jgi:hypothetical protein
MVLDSIKWVLMSNVSLEPASLLPNMRWTYTFFVAIHFLLHAVAQPILSVGPDKGALELTRREPLPAQPPPRRSTRVKKQNPDYVTSPTPAKGLSFLFSQSSTC